ncbi:PucR family transcriptional regulator [Anaerobacillus alkalilacustris]|uniref:PucR family transcriptional regulator n=1 Tax=Anaerobacillus alkalilacustris TaxID=393763 RepID=A0A1S2LHU2_9BACI|nr:PucR family transcriptional regulator [Anaerobacillus alkalilacustris]OIJ12089.1 PucR family transcriptional regulator [Anaerobacillus alkalilacustris]
MKLVEVLALPTFKEAKVVAGHHNLANVVQSVNLMDAPDIIHYLNQGQLLLTTAYSIKNNPVALIELVQQMSEQGCAALGLKTKRYIEEIPEEVITEANERNFPIIELPLHYSLGEMLTEALSGILKERTEELNYALSIHREFTDIVISGGGLTNVINSLSSILDVPVILLNTRLEIMASSKDIDREAFFSVYKYIHDITNQEQINQYKVLTLPLNDTTSEYKQFSLYPIHTTNQQKGYVVILGTSLKQQYSSLLAVEQAANVISFEFMRLHAIEQQSRRLKNEFFSDLVDGIIATEEEIINRGKIYTIDKSLQYICITCKLDQLNQIELEKHSLKAEKKIHSQRDLIYDLLDTVLIKQLENSILFTKGDIFAILVGFEFYNETIEQEVLEMVRQTQLDMIQTSNISLSFGISNFAENIKDIPVTYKEAVEALRLGYRENEEAFIKTYRTKELTELLKSIPSQKLKEFYKSTLKELAYPEDKEKQDLVQTLSCFLNNNCQISETAKSMYIHRNTVIYRIKKCEDILGRDLKSADETLRLRISFLLKSILL